MFEARLSDNANWDFDNVVLQYANISKDLAERFIESFDYTISKLETFPFYQVRYDNFRVRQGKNFPVLVHFIIYEDLKLIIVEGVRFGQENPENYPTK